MILALVTAIVLLNAELGAEKEVLAGLRAIENVKEVYEVYGAYDIVVKVEAGSQADLNWDVFGKIRKLGRVRSTLTMLVME